MARVHATVAETGMEVVEGFSSSAQRGAGIRVYEYASRETTAAAKLQLETLFWSCFDSDDAVIEAGMPAVNASRRRRLIESAAEGGGLADEDRFQLARMVNADGITICPLCLEPISAFDFMRRSEQADGREVYDLTTTEVSLFHIEELRIGRLQHKPYNLGWGHHFCNVVVKDAGIIPTLSWMQAVLDRQPKRTLTQEARLVEKAVDG